MSDVQGQSAATSEGMGSVTETASVEGTQSYRSSSQESDDSSYDGSYSDSDSSASSTTSADTHDDGRSNATADAAVLAANFPIEEDGDENGDETGVVQGEKRSRSVSTAGSSSSGYSGSGSSSDGSTSSSSGSGSDSGSDSESSSSSSSDEESDDAGSDAEEDMLKQMMTIEEKAEEAVLAGSGAKPTAANRGRRMRGRRASIAKRGVKRTKETKQGALGDTASNQSSKASLGGGKGGNARKVPRASQSQTNIRKRLVKRGGSSRSSVASLSQSMNRDRKPRRTVRMSTSSTGKKLVKKGNRNKASRKSLSETSEANVNILCLEGQVEHTLLPEREPMPAAGGRPLSEGQADAGEIDLMSGLPRIREAVANETMSPPGDGRAATAATRSPMENEEDMNPDGDVYRDEGHNAIDGAYTNHANVVVSPSRPTERNSEHHQGGGSAMTSPSTRPVRGSASPRKSRNKVRPTLRDVPLFCVYTDEEMPGQLPLDADLLPTSLEQAQRFGERLRMDDWWFERLDMDQLSCGYAYDMYKVFLNRQRRDFERRRCYEGAQRADEYIKVLRDLVSKKRVIMLDTHSRKVKDEVITSLNIDRVRLETQWDTVLDMLDSHQKEEVEAMLEQHDQLRDVHIAKGTNVTTPRCGRRLRGLRQEENAAVRSRDYAKAQMIRDRISKLELREKTSQKTNTASMHDRADRLKRKCENEKVLLLDNHRARRNGWLRQRAADLKNACRRRDVMVKELERKIRGGIAKLAKHAHSTKEMEESGWNMKFFDTQMSLEEASQLCPYTYLQHGVETMERSRELICAAEAVGWRLVDANGRSLTSRHSSLKRRGASRPGTNSAFGTPAQVTRNVSRKLYASRSALSYRGPSKTPASADTSWTGVSPDSNSLRRYKPVAKYHPHEIPGVTDSINLQQSYFEVTRSGASSGDTIAKAQKRARGKDKNGVMARLSVGNERQTPRGYQTASSTPMQPAAERKRRRQAGANRDRPFSTRI